MPLDPCDQFYHGSVVDIAVEIVDPAGEDPIDSGSIDGPARDVLFVTKPSMPFTGKSSLFWFVFNS